MNFLQSVRNRLIDTLPTQTYIVVDLVFSTVGDEFFFQSIRNRLATNLPTLSNLDIVVVHGLGVSSLPKRGMVRAIAQIFVYGTKISSRVTGESKGVFWLPTSIGRIEPFKLGFFTSTTLCINQIKYSLNK